MSEHANIVDKAEAFYLDWECACNLCEDEFGGSTFDWYVRDWMLKHGWSQADIDARKDLFAVRSMAKALRDFSTRGTHCDTNPTRRVPPTEEAQNADSWWLSYLGRADQNVRLRAIGVLKDAGVAV